MNNLWFVEVPDWHQNLSASSQMSCWYGLRVLDTGVHLSVYVDDLAYTFVGPQMPEWVVEDLARRLGISVKEVE